MFDVCFSLLLLLLLSHVLRYSNAERECSTKCFCVFIPLAAGVIYRDAFSCCFRKIKWVSHSRAHTHAAPHTNTHKIYEIIYWTPTRTRPFPVTRRQMEERNIYILINNELNRIERNWIGRYFECLCLHFICGFESFFYRRRRCNVYYTYFILQWISHSLSAATSMYVLFRIVPYISRHVYLMVVAMSMNDHVDDCEECVLVGRRLLTIDWL